MKEFEDIINARAGGIINDKEMVEKLRALVKKLQGCEQKLNALEAVGVDNWEGYDYAMELLEEEQNEPAT